MKIDRLTNPTFRRGPLCSRLLSFPWNDIDNWALLLTLNNLTSCNRQKAAPLLFVKRQRNHQRSVTGVHFSHLSARYIFDRIRGWLICDLGRNRRRRTSHQSSPRRSRNFEIGRHGRVDQEFRTAWHIFFFYTIVFSLLQAMFFHVIFSFIFLSFF